MDDSNLPLGVLLLGVAGLAGFLAFRPWPTSSGNPIKPGAYAVEILQGHPPAASAPPDRQGDIAVIEGGLVTLLGVWAAAKLSGALSGLSSAGGAAAGAAAGASGEGEAIGDEIATDVEAAG